MRSIAKRPTPGPGRASIAVWTSLLAVGLCASLGASERQAQRQPTSQESGSRTVVPRSTPSPSPSGTAQSAPTARDTRRLPPQRYRHSSPPPSGSRGSGHHRGYVGAHVGYYYPGYYYPSWRWGWWGPWWYGPYYWGWGGQPLPPSGVGYPATNLGGLDLNVKPKKAAVYIDGQYVGLVKQFDGYPSYLWLEKGTYELSFVREGYATITRTFEVRPGLVFDVRLRLHPGESVLPEERTAAVGGPAKSGTGVAPPSAAAPASTGPRQPTVSTEETGRLQFVVEPADATVYLDGRLLGSGEELEALRAGLIVEPGRHTVEVVRPGYSPQEMTIFVEPGGELDLKVRLDEDRG